MDNISELWNAVLEELQTSVTKVAFDLWINVLEPISFENSTFTVRVGAFKKKIIMERFYQDIEKALEAVIGFKVKLEIVSLPGSDSAPSVARSSEIETDAFAAMPEIEKSFEPSFENFIVGSTNQFAYSLAVAVAKRPGKVHNPLFIYGHSGLGKTHLLKAIRHEIEITYPNINILYTNGESFMNEMIDHLAEKNMADFHQKYRTTDVLLMDDVQFIGGKVSVQEEFFYTFEALTNEGKQIVLTSDRPPKEIQSLTERLRSRFIQGVLADIQPPVLETRIAIIKRKSQTLGMNIPEDVVEFMAEKLKNNVRQIEGVVKRLYYSSYMVNGTAPTIISANEAIKDVISYIQPTEVTINRIIEYVAKTFGVTPEEIRSDRKKMNITNARQIAMYIIREVTDLSLEEIGNQFGGKKHSTVLYSLDSVEAKMEGNASLKNTVYDILKNIQDDKEG